MEIVITIAIILLATVQGFLWGLLYCQKEIKAARQQTKKVMGEWEKSLDLLKKLSSLAGVVMTETSIKSPIQPKDLK